MSSPSNAGDGLVGVVATGVGAVALVSIDLASSHAATDDTTTTSNNRRKRMASLLVS